MPAQVGTRVVFRCDSFVSQLPECSFRIPLYLSFPAGIFLLLSSWVILNHRIKSFFKEAGLGFGTHAVPKWEECLVRPSLA
jgi:hypothetical protein